MDISRRFFFIGILNENIVQCEGKFLFVFQCNISL